MVIFLRWFPIFISSFMCQLVWTVQVTNRLLYVIPWFCRPHFSIYYISTSILHYSYHITSGFSTAGKGRNSEERSQSTQTPGGSYIFHVYEDPVAVCLKWKLIELNNISQLVVCLTDPGIITTPMYWLYPNVFWKWRTRKGRFFV